MNLLGAAVVLGLCGFCNAEIVKSFDARRDRRRFCNGKCRFNAWYWDNREHNNRKRAANYRLASLRPRRA